MGTAVNSHKKIMKMFQWRIMLISSLGLLIMGLTIVFFGIDEAHPDNDMDTVCAMRSYLPAMGFALFFQALAAKLYRVKRIFGRSMQKSVIKDTDLLKLMAPGIATVLTLILIWHFMDPPVRVIEMGPVLETSDPYLVERTDTGMCKCGSTGETFGLLVLAVNLISVIMASGWAWETRNVWFPAINDSKQTSYVTLFTCVVGGFTVLLLYMTRD